MIPPLAVSFLINPRSGGGEGGWVHEKLPEILASFGYAKREWSAKLLSGQETDDEVVSTLRTSKKVVAVGGDGTIGSVLNLVRRHRVSGTEIGLVPLGTGNDLSRALGIYRIYRHKGLLACIKRLLRASATDFDLWQVNEVKTLVAFASVGMDAAILHDFDAARSRGRIPTSAFMNKVYYLSRLASRMGARITAPVRMEWETPEGTRSMDLGGVCCCLVANINSYAAGAVPFSESEFHDGMLDVIVFPGLGSYIALGLFSRLHNRMSNWIPGSFIRFRTGRLRLSRLEGEYVQLDGEAVDRPDVMEFSLGHRARLLDLRRPPYQLF